MKAQELFNNLVENEIFYFHNHGLELTRKQAIKHIKKIVKNDQNIDKQVKNFISKQ